MERRIGSLWADVVEPESAKFTAPLVLIHGLWGTAGIWRGFTGYLAHRGWLCVSVQLHRDGSAGGPTSLAGHVENLRRLLVALPAPAVLVGYDLGALLALLLADAGVAAVALSPIVTPLMPRSELKRVVAGSRTDRLLGRLFLAPPRRWRHVYSDRRSELEPAALLDELQRLDVDVPRLPASVPGLIMVGGRDALTSADAARALADRINAELRIEPEAGHALPVEPAWERRVSEIHKWVVQRLGRPLLALFDDSFDSES